MNDSDHQIPIDQIPIGTICEFEIRDAQNVLLISPGETLTELAREQISIRGVDFVQVSASQYASFRNQIRGGPDSVASKKASENRTRVDRRKESYCPLRLQKIARQIEASASLIATIGEKIDCLNIDDVRLLRECPGQFVPMLRDDSDQMLFSLNDVRSPYSLPHRCIQLSVLSMNTAIELGLLEEEIVTIGIAGLIHDLGLFTLSRELQDPCHALTDDAAWQFRRHPQIVEGLLANYSIIPEAARVLARQVHERSDGSGYPGGLRQNLQHPHSNILSFVDCYLTLISPGPGRPAIVPFDAIRLLLLAIKNGRFDVETAQAFIAHMSIYAIGSEVQLESGERAVVKRRNADEHFRPVVEEQNGSILRRIDLAETGIRVSHPVPNAKLGQMRFHGELAKEVDVSLFERG